MKYEKPKCNCGEELIYVTTAVYQVDYKITNNGVRYIYPFYKGSSYTDGCAELRCQKCGNRYESDFQNHKIYCGKEVE
jgi:hypothetical protein